MKKWMTRLAVCLIASVLGTGAFAMRAWAESDMQGLISIQLTQDEQSFTFEPTVNGLYSVWLFPENENTRAKATIKSQEGTLAEGEGTMRLMSVRLTVGETVTLNIEGEGEGRLEITRDALSRSFETALELEDGEAYSKLIARAGDAHWYAFEAKHSGACILAVSPEQETFPQESGMQMQICLMSDQGAVLAESENLPSGTAVVSAELQEGERYYLRVSAKNDATGKYYLTSLRSAASETVDAVSFSREEWIIEGRSFAEMEVELEMSENAASLLWLDSSNSAVAIAVNGVLEGRMPGTAVITAYAFGGATAQCSVQVEKVAVENLRFGETALELSAGSTATLKTEILPSYASDLRVTYSSADESIATVDARGKVTAVAEGETIITVQTLDGAHCAQATVTVTPRERRYRALLIGEQNYASTVDKVRTGSINSVENIAGLLQSFAGTKYEVETLMDAPRDSVIAGIRETFADAADEDVSLIYITCHGFYEAGMSFFVMADGSVLSARDLERELRGIPGEIILLADCCGSGGLIGEVGSAQELVRGVTSVFQGAQGGASIRGSRYRVIASALLDQDSYRISFSGSDEDGMATVFARALCDAAGWSMDRGTRSAMNADADYDGEITLVELGDYMERRVSWYLALVGDYAQSVCVYPEGDNFTVFSNIAPQ